MAQTQVAQINVRLPRDLKEAGDGGLHALGISPSDAVRALWTRLSSHEEELARVQAFLLGEDPHDNDSAPSFDQSELMQGWRMIDNVIAQLGISAAQESIPWSPKNDEDLVASALEDRMQERGLM